MKTIFKLLVTLIGIASFIFCITGEIDGVGRFACIVFGTVVTLVGSFMGHSRKG